jgi:hypothetical protein
MTRTTLSLLMAGAMALAGVANAQTFDTPTQAGEPSTMTSGQPNQLTTHSPYGDGAVVVDTTVLGAAPIAMTTVVPPYVYAPPSVTDRQAAATFNVPARAGEASTMTGGAPNMVTDNSSLIVGGYSLPPAPRGMAPIYYGN